MEKKAKFWVSEADLATRSAAMARGRTLFLVRREGHQAVKSENACLDLWRAS